MSERATTAAAGVLVSLAVSVVAWQLFDTAFLFLVVPFVPFLFRRGDDRPPVRECSECGFQTRNSEFDYCPRDGTDLDVR